MTEPNRGNWFSKAENVWLLVATALGLINFFLILLLWNISGTKIDVATLSVSLTVLEIFLAIIAVSGFFLIRGAAMGRAEEEATVVAEKITKRVVAELAPPMVRREVTEYMSLLEQKSGTLDTTDSTNATMQALDDGGEDA